MFGLFLTILAIGALIFLIDRHVFSPKRTKASAERYMEETITNTPFESFIQPEKRIVHYMNLPQTAHRDVLEVRGEKPRWIVELDVHPSMSPYLSISQSNTVTLSSKEEYQRLQNAVNTRSSLDRWLTKQEDLNLLQEVRFEKEKLQNPENYTLHVVSEDVSDAIAKQFKPTTLDWVALGYLGFFVLSWLVL
jgi:hypothetical protein